MGSILFAAAMLPLMWLFLIRPQQKKVKNQRSLVDSLAVGDRVITAAGIIGVITEIEGDELLLEAGPEVELRFTKFAVTQRLTDADEEIDLVVAQELLRDPDEMELDNDIEAEEDRNKRRGES